MKDIKRLQYSCIAVLVVIFFEGMMTLGACFDFENYNAFGWIVQGVILGLAITTAFRLADEGN